MSPQSPHSNARVALIRCETYDPAAVETAVSRGLELLGGISTILDGCSRVLLKPNVLMGYPPERCVSTHPAVFGAVARLLQQAGKTLGYGDSPGHVLPVKYNMEKALIAPEAQKLQIPLADFEHGDWVSTPGGVSSKKLFLVNALRDYDVLVSLPKLKTHGLVRLTGAVKNQYGCIPGMVKGEYHARFPDVYDLSRLLVDLNLHIRPRLFVMDAIMAMEGNGPRSGTPRKLGALLLSTDPVALDSVACRLVAMDPGCVPTNPLGEQAGLGVMDSTRITIVGDRLEELVDRAFVIVRQPPSALPASAFMRQLKTLVTPRPVIRSGRCTRCGMCVKVCPLKPPAVDFRDSARRAPPRYDYQRCIRCFCCQEMCPAGAIEIHTPLIRRLLPPLSYIALLLSNARSRLRRKLHG